MNFDQHETGAWFLRGVDGGMYGFDQRTLSHAARAPEKSIVGGQSLRETARIFEQSVSGLVDTLEKLKRKVGDMLDRQETAERRLPYERVAAGRSLFDRPWRDPIER